MRHKLLAVFGLAAVLGLAGCGTTPTSSSPATSSPTASPGGGLNDLVSFTKADLEAAEHTAVATNDKVAQPCFPALETWLDSVGGTAGEIQVKGLFSGAEAGRAVVNGIDAGIPDTIYEACGPLYMRVQAEIASKGLKGALLLH